MNMLCSGPEWEAIPSKLVCFTPKFGFLFNRSKRCCFELKHGGAELYYREKSLDEIEETERTVLEGRISGRVKNRVFQVLEAMEEMNGNSLKRCLDEKEEPEAKMAKKEGSWLTSKLKDSDMRSYQLEAYEAALRRNTIVWLETGAGKTMIAIMLMKEIARQLRAEADKRIIIFLAPTVHLVHQQCSVIKTQADLRAEEYYGAKGMDDWDFRCWQKEACEKEVLSFHVFKLGSEGVSSAEDCEYQISELEEILDSKVFTLEDRNDLEVHVPMAIEIKRYYSSWFVNVDLKGELDSLWTKAVKVCMQRDGVSLDIEENASPHVLLSNYLKEALQIFKGYLSAEVCDLLETEAHLDPVYMNFISPKLCELVNSVNALRNQKQVLCMIFVERIITAKVICWLIKKLKFLSHLSCDYMTGNTSAVNGLTAKRQKMIMDSFREGKVNLLLTTDVAEEGIDVHNCSCVIRFDLPKSVRSYIQSRGRARYADSLYVLMLERSERAMQDATSSRDKTTVPKLSPKDDAPLYTVSSTGATVTPDSSVSLIFSYCQKLPGDKYFHPKPDFRYELSGGFSECTLTLPPNAAFRHLKGPPAKSNQLAKKLVCLEACKKLHEMKALDDHLLPLSEQLPVLAKEVNSAPGAGTTRRKELHGSATADALSGTWANVLGSITLQAYSLFFSCNIIEENYPPFIFLMKEELDEDVAHSEMDLFLHNNKVVKAHASPCGQVYLDTDQDDKKPEKIHLVDGSYGFHDLKDMVVFAIHTGRFYYVAELVNDATANSPFDGSYDSKKPSYNTYADYFKKKYGINLHYKTQPLLWLKQCHKAHNLLSNRGQEDASLNSNGESDSVSPAKEQQGYVYMPPELLIRLDVSKDILRSFYLLPSLVHRMESKMLASQLRRAICFRPDGHQIPVDLILEALTTRRCAEDFSLERLELLGDSVLKYVNYIRDSPFDPDRWLAPGERTWRPFPCKCGVHSREVPLTHPTDVENSAIKIGVACDLGHRWLCSKTVSDCLEALIGAYYVSGGLEAACLFMTWVGIDCEHDQALVEEAIRKASEFSSAIEDKNIASLESKLGYKFLNKGLLLEAITHASQQEASSGCCYQRLEFLGDSVLDLLITWHLFESHKDNDQGELTDLRSASVNNEKFAQAAVKHNLQKHLLHGSDLLLTQIRDYVKFLKSFPEDAPLPSYSKTKGPKVLGDLVESIAGAILIDSKLNLGEVWRVFKHLLSPFPTPDDLQLHPLRELGEICGEAGCPLGTEFRKEGDQTIAKLTVQLKDGQLAAEGFISKVILHLPDSDTVEVEGAEKADKKSSMDSAALALLYKLGELGKCIIEEC
ncbi:Endoribonuclease Dicer-like protein 3a [Nymphaea thermarum]|nr:Endoribonuclease Dicer-like protein 3a [Nymphaea thermarum]